MPAPKRYRSISTETRRPSKSSVIGCSNRSSNAHLPLAFFASSGVRDLTKLKAAKLLYLADRYHVLTYGRPITGDRYIAMDLGPVPEGAFQLISRLVEPVEVNDDARQLALAHLNVHRGFLQKYLIDVGEAGELEVGREEFRALYETDEIVYKGLLSANDVVALVAKIVASVRVRRRFKQVLTGK